MRLSAYTRLSQSNDHEEESHEGQRQRIELWAAHHGHEIVGQYRDTASGTADVNERPGLADLLNALSDGEADGTVVASMDRLSRDLLVQEGILRSIWGEGHELFSAAEGEANLRDDPEDPSRKMLRHILGAVVGYERDMAALRMARGRRRAVSRGRLIGPAPTFGWVRDPQDRGRAVPDPQTFKLVEEAVQRRNAGVTLREIASYLATSTGRRWHPTQVQRLCDRFERYARAT